jgi:hypothetical protein
MSEELIRAEAVVDECRGVRGDTMEFALDEAFDCCPSVKGVKRNIYKNLLLGFVKGL